MSLSKIGILLLSIQIVCVYSLDEKCSKNVDCTDANSLCLNGKCTCGPFAYFSTSNNACLTYVTEFGAYCLEDKQCDFLGDNSVCKKSNCVCQDQYRWFQGKCQKYVHKGDKCKTDLDCFDGVDSLAMSCSTDGKCGCSKGFYDRGHDCRRISPAEGSECSFTIDCQNDTLICTRGKCVIPSEEFDDDDSLVTVVHLELPHITISEEGSSCNYDDDCRNIANSQCRNSTCQCKAGHYQSKSNGNCWPGLSACNSNSACSDSNAFCYLSTSCICKQGYFYKSGNCVPELGNPDAITCGNISASVLIDDTCYCRNYWYGSINNRECSKSTFQPTLTCTTNEWCNGLGPYSFCQKGDASGECTCNSYAQLDNSTYYCEKVKENTDGECSRDRDCSYNQQCINAQCQCIPGFTNSSGTCLPDIGGSCETLSCNHIENAECINGICECTLDSIGQDNVCMKMADNLYDICQVDAQCAKLNFTICALQDGAENKTCICAEEYVDVNIEGTYICMASKKYGSPCMKSTDCTLVLNRSFLCRNSICQCPVGATSKNGYCSGSLPSFSIEKVLPLVLLFLLYKYRIELI